MTKDTEERVWMCICIERNMGHGPKVDMLLNTPLKIKAEVEDPKH